MEYVAKTPPRVEDPTMQIWSPDGHWIADVRERAWPGTVETVLAALNKHDALCQMLADYQLATGACYKIMGLDENSTCCQLENSMQIMMDDRYRLNDELKSIVAENIELTALLRNIGDFAHEHSAGPEVQDDLWEVRRMAYQQ